MDKIHLEDLSPGQIFRTASVTMTEDDIFAFAGRYDPQYFHLDPEAAKESFFQGLAASGWHTAAATMRLLVTSDLGRLAWGVIGAGLEDLRWHRPVRPGDVLTAEAEVLDIRPSRSKPGQGLVRFRVTTRDQQGEPVQIFTTPLLVPARPT